MANDKHKPPTRAEAIERARVLVAAEGGEVPGFDMAAGIVDNMIARGWLEVAPEPVAPKRGDLLTENTELVDRMVVRDRDGEVFAYWEPHGTWYCADGVGEQFTTAGVINYGARIIDVPGVADTPEPAPTDTREEVSEAIARLLEQFGEDVLGDPIRPDIAAWIAREYGKRNMSPIAQLRDKLAGEGGRS